MIHFVTKNFIRLQTKATKLRRQALSEDLSDDDRMVFILSKIIVLIQVSCN